MINNNQNNSITNNLFNNAILDDLQNQKSVIEQ